MLKVIVLKGCELIDNFLNEYLHLLTIIGSKYSNNVIENIELKI